MLKLAKKTEEQTVGGVTWDVPDNVDASDDMTSGEGKWKGSIGTLIL